MTPQDRIGLVAMSPSRPPSLIVNPADDLRFASAVRVEMANGATTPAALADALRLEYPDVLVRPRDLAGDPMATWYVYRDGHWSPVMGSRERHE